VNATSYPFNAVAFRKDPRLSNNFPDGTSNTIAVAEHYSFDCQNSSFDFMQSSAGSGPSRRATFADWETGDLYPPPGTGLPHPRSIPSDGVSTFQVRPSLDRCNPAVPQTPHSGGMLVGMIDGSVRTVSGGMSPTTFWAAVTPAGAETLGTDW
jgi:hypothetical protein